MSIGNEQWIKNLTELWLDPNGNYHKFMQTRAPRLPVEDAPKMVMIFAEWTE